jgi:PLP dependent protein
MDSITNKLQEVKRRLAAASTLAGRAPGSVQLLAVSKTQSEAAVREAFACGQRAFGENYVQEALVKISALADLRSAALAQPIEWHLIGPLQSNKTRAVAESFDWVHTVCRLKIAERLAEQRPAHLRPLQVCLQVNIDGGANKSGVLPDQALALAQAVARLPAHRLRLRGLMSIPEPATGAESHSPGDNPQRVPHRALHALLGQLNAAGLQLDTLSMGMSADMDAAVTEGSTLVRVGSAIFGPR